MFVNKKLLGVLFVTVLLLSACGGGSSNEVKITLTDFGIEASRTSFEVGVPYHFVVKNDGAIEHEIMLMTPLTGDQMMMDMDMEEMDAMALAHVEADELPAGATAEFDYTFTEPDTNLELSCHIAGHYEAGMKLPITVK